MKKLIVLTFCAFCAAWAQAESMQFVTLLSQPVGTFAKVKLLDAGKAASITNLNFCQPGLDGTIDVASEGVEIDQLKVRNTLGGNAQSYLTETIKLKIGNSPELNGKFLTTGIMQVASEAAELKSLKINVQKEVVISSDVTSKAASFQTMNLVDKAVLKHAASSDGLAQSMSWKTHKKEGTSEDGPALLVGEPTFTIQD